MADKERVTRIFGIKDFYHGEKFLKENFDFNSN